MYAIWSYYGFVWTEVFMFFNNLLFIDFYRSRGFFVSSELLWTTFDWRKGCPFRITSYNVCYMKLLRICSAGHSGLMSDQSEITSYSIHYTKLYDYKNIKNVLLLYYTGMWIVTFWFVWTEVFMFFNVDDLIA